MMAASVAGRLARCVALAALTLFVTLAVTETRAQNNAGGSAGLKQARFLKQARQSPSGTINVRSAKEFGDLTSTPRDYSISMLLTAVDSPPINCAPCKAFQPVFESVAKGYKAAAAKTASPSQHMFAVLEFKEGREVFQRMQLTYAPVLFFYPPTSGPNASPSSAHDTYDFNRLGFDGEDLADDLSKRLGLVIKYHKPFPWKMAGMMGSAVLAVTALGFVIVPRLSAIDFSLGYLGSLICKAVVLATITIMCAGYMWNGIRNAPYVTTDQAGRTQYFAAGFQNQNGAETQIVAMVYGILAFAFTSLAVLVPMQRDPVKQRAGVYVWSAILLAAFSLLLYIFRLKNPSYPFRLFF